MKKKNIFLFFIVITFASIFLYFYYQPKIKESQVFGTKSKPYSISIDKSLMGLMEPKIKQFFKSKNTEYELKDNGEISISTQSKNYQKNEEITTIYNQKFSKIKHNKWQSNNQIIYLNYNNKSKTIAELKNYLISEFKNQKWSMISTGDIMLARHVGKKIIEASNWSLPFLKTAKFLNSVDITISNLESPFAQGSQTIFEGMTFGADEKTVEGLKSAGIDVVSLANNHFGNQGNSGMNNTFELLKNNKIEYIGAGKNYQDSHMYKIININGLKIAFLAYDGVDSTPKAYAADKKYPGLARWDIKQVKIDIKKAQKNADMVIVSMHAGTEYVYKPRQDQISFAHSAIDAGADMVIGHHPHTIQTIEKYKGKMIFYSLGNFIFDQMWSEKTREGIIIKFELTNNQIKSFEIIPIYIENYNQPRFLDESNDNRILNYILPDSKF